MLTTSTNNLGPEKEWTLAELADDTTLGGELDVLVSGVAIHKNFNMVQEWAERSHEIQQIKIQNPAPGTRKLHATVQEEGEGLGNSFAQKDPGEPGIQRAEHESAS